MNWPARPSNYQNGRNNVIYLAIGAAIAALIVAAQAVRDCHGQRALLVSAHNKLDKAAEAHEDIKKILIALNTVNKNQRFEIAALRVLLKPREKTTGDEAERVAPI